MSVTRIERGCRVLAAAILLLLWGTSTAPAAPAAPCTAKEYRAMDFAIGTWVARDGKGKVIGTGVWQPILPGCAMRFTWRGHSYNGTANDGYDANRSLWQKAWVSDHGDVELSERHSSMNRMVYVGYDYQNGKRVQMHRENLVLLSDGLVQFHLDVSTNRERTWKLAGDALYTKVKSG